MTGWEGQRNNGLPVEQQWTTLHRMTALPSSDPQKQPDRATPLLGPQPQLHTLVMCVTCTV